MGSEAAVVLPGEKTSVAVPLHRLDAAVQVPWHHHVRMARVAGEEVRETQGDRAPTRRPADLVHSGHPAFHGLKTTVRDQVLGLGHPGKQEPAHKGQRE
ncbi:MAG: hypothetical protein GFGODING_03232 [Flavobacteriales bacterium]|nr:hypothetical protein [Flavobacteriales bacterium]